MSRSYLPSSLTDLAQDWEREGPRTDGAVVAQDESEESEYDALMEAAEGSAERVAGAPDGLRRRVVVVVGSGADVAPRWSDVVAVHADDRDDTDPDDELGWWALQEVPQLLVPPLERDTNL